MATKVFNESWKKARQGGKKASQILSPFSRRVMCSKSSRQVELVFECTYCSSTHYNKTEKKDSQLQPKHCISWDFINYFFIYEMCSCRCACNVGEKTYTIHVNDGVIRLNRNGSERNQRGRGRVTLQPAAGEKSLYQLKNKVDNNNRGQRGQSRGNWRKRRRKTQKTRWTTTTTTTWLIEKQCGQQQPWRGSWREIIEE